MKKVTVSETNTSIKQTIISFLGSTVSMDSNGQYVVDVPGYVQIIAFWVLIGWFVFVQYFGIGLVSLPMDLIMDFF